MVGPVVDLHTGECLAHLKLSIAMLALLPLPYVNLGVVVTPICLVGTPPSFEFILNVCRIFHLNCRKKEGSRTSSKESTNDEKGKPAGRKVK